MKATAFSLITLFLLLTGCTTAQKPESESETKTTVQRPGQMIRGIYLPVTKATNLPLINQLLEESKGANINQMVLDVQTYNGMTMKHNPAVIALLKSQNFDVVARVVCFQDGLKAMPDKRTLSDLFTVIEDAAEAGFDEIQLDYIRFADGEAPFRLKTKYDFIESVLKRAKEITDKYEIRLSADLFGRVVYNRDDNIGQKVENFAKYADIIYPMLYPSHFHGDMKRLSNPGFTVREGTEKALARVDPAKTQIRPYIQAFGYNIGYARVSLQRYIELQIEELQKTNATGWVAWNAHGDYAPLFAAIRAIEERNTKVITETVPVEGKEQ